MYKKILLLSVLATFSTHTWATDSGNTNQSKLSSITWVNSINPGMLKKQKDNLDKTKNTLIQNIDKATQQCRCLIDSVKGKSNLFPVEGDTKNSNTYANDMKYGYIDIKTQYIYNQTIADMVKTANKEQADIKAIVEKWPEDIKVIIEKWQIDNKRIAKKEEVEGIINKIIKDLEIKVSEGLRAFSSFCTAPFDKLSDEIYKRSSILTRKKIDGKSCGIVRNKK